MCIFSQPVASVTDTHIFARLSGRRNIWPTTRIPTFSTNPTGLIRSQNVAKTFCDITKSKGIVDPNLLVHRQIIRGSHPNQDTEIATFGDPTRPTHNLRPLWSYTPWLIVVTAITWLFARRAKMKRNLD